MLFELLVSLSMNQKPEASEKLSVCKLAPSRLEKNICSYKYKIRTNSETCQDFYNQGLGYLYSYVWMEAARSFETALKYDPDCLMAHVGLAKALDRWGKRKEGVEVLKKAQRLEQTADPREKFFLQAAFLEYGVGDKLPTAGEARTKATVDLIDQAISQYEDDQELWFTRAQIACNYRTFGGNANSAPFYKALIRLNPNHPGANHELVHFHEGQQRPALGWPYAEGYLNSSSGIPHAQHMQAHLATRLGKWQKTSDRSTKALELELDYHKAMSVKPAEDHQFAHHVQTLLLSLTHDGRFQQAQKLDNTRPDKNKPSVAWFRLQLARHDWTAAETEARRFLKTDKATAYYLLTLLELQKDNAAGALPFLESMQQLWASSKKDKQLEYRIWEIQGRWLCQQGSLDAGLKLLRKAVERSKNDYSHHSWGNGSYFMEIWGLEALRGQKYDEAEEAFLEALAHDPGSTRAALGMKLLCEQNGRTAEAGDYFKLAKKSWAKADEGILEKELESIRIYTLKSTPSQ